MRMCVALLLTAGWAHGEIRDVVKTEEIVAKFRGLDGESALEERPNFAIVLRAMRAKAGQAGRDRDELWFVRSGSAGVWLDSKEYDVGAGDVVLVPRQAAWRVKARGGPLESIVVRVIPAKGASPEALRKQYSARQMPNVLKKAEIDATFASAESNRPVHAAQNFTVNYVIYKGRSGPWEAHRGCVDIYFLHTGTATAQLGGTILNAKEEVPGEIRGEGVAGSRRYSVEPGDVVLIPRNTAHHMDPGAGKLGYLLVKVWAE